MKRIINKKRLHLVPEVSSQNSEFEAPEDTDTAPSSVDPWEGTQPDKRTFHYSLLLRPEPMDA
jgi:hypothetical protein